MQHSNGSQLKRCPSGPCPTNLAGADCASTGFVEAQKKSMSGTMARMGSTSSRPRLGVSPWSKSFIPPTTRDRLGKLAYDFIPGAWGCSIRGPEMFQTSQLDPHWGATWPGGRGASVRLWEEAWRGLVDVSGACTVDGSWLICCVSISRVGGTCPLAQSGHFWRRGGA